ncbi:hypothetical protein AX768_09095 [Burkholderia sp. PAMC 28687]|uniref:hypothetical protein n=1 Tax=Burkholderia sp. PAMC 28687 TaxID=1795874 RepID=UPI00078655CE|nr:hypothetical protein [Burkholderia sp. PAMC 28687]AMM14226.1 hypothetical protein AX768_09095 [Burkholderia sp. PAMC 28687]
MNKPAIPVDFDDYALDMARRIASIDRARLPGSTAQFTAVIQATIVDAMLFASAYAREPHVMVKGNSIVMSPAMPMADHEMDVLRAIASRLKFPRCDWSPVSGSSLSLGVVVSLNEETKPC